jgi:hypothetical protein
MAISQFTEPDVDLFFDDLTQVIRLDNKAAFYGKGYINAGLSNMDNTNIPVLSQGSMFECGCVLFIGGSNTGIPGTHSGGLNYIYFNPSDKSLSYSTDRPEWNAVKGGWYKGNNRALALLYFYKGEYRGKRVIGGVQDDLMPGDTGYIDEGGTSVSIPGYIDNAKNIYQFYLPPGAYRYILVSGTGGGDAFQQNGGIPNQGSSVLGMFIWNGGTIRIMTGGDGFKGGNGGGSLRKRRGQRSGRSKRNSRDCKDLSG